MKTGLKFHLFIPKAKSRQGSRALHSLIHVDVHHCPTPFEEPRWWRNIQTVNSLWVIFQVYLHETVSTLILFSITQLVD